MGRADGKVFLCFGGASGMGAASSRLFAKEGAKVIIADLSEEAGNTVAAQIKEAGGEATFVKTDCLIEQEIANAVTFAANTYTKVDISFYTPGINITGSIDEVTLERWNIGLQLNLTGVFLYLKYVTAQMKKNGSGVACMVSSENSTVPTTKYGNYCATKAAVDMLCKVAAMECGRDNIRIFSVNPGLVQTDAVKPFTDTEVIFKMYKETSALGRAAIPEEIASAVLCLTSDDFSYLTGTSVFLDGGASLYGYPDAVGMYRKLRQQAEAQKNQNQ